MLRAVTGAAASRRSNPEQQPTKSGWLYDLIVPTLQSLSRRAYTHPIHTIAFVAIVASTTYLKLLDTDLFEPPESSHTAVGQVDFPGLLTGSRTLQINADTAWKWQNADDYEDGQQPLASQELALMTLVFPESTFHGSSVPMPQSRAFNRLSNTSFTPLPSSKNLLSPISQESTLAFSVPLSTAPDFVASVKELGVFEAASIVEEREDDGLTTEEKLWIMSAVKGDAGVSPRNFKRRAGDAWNAFVDLLKNAEELDIIIMALGYISMHLTFVSLFASLRKLGSNAWLGTAVLTSSVFAMLFGLIVTFYFDVPINMVLLSEGLPFLVVIIGFEKPIILTKAVLSASLAMRASNQPDSPVDQSNTRAVDRASSSISRAVQSGVADCGVEVVRDYAIEIFILVLGAASRVQGGLCQFCFLAAWILFFDCILLFTFYTAFLTIKLEINRIKRHVALRRALEEDGVSRNVAEQVAASDEWPNMNKHSKQMKTKSNEFSVFGLKAGDSSISRFKVLMVSGFIAINLVNFATIPFRSGARSTGSALSSPVTQPPMDPFKVAGNGLESIAIAAKKAKLSTLVTILTPIKYELQYPSVHYAIPEDDSSSIFDLDFTDGLFDKFGGRVVEGILKSFEDPFLGKWIIIALALSLILNGYLFNAARWTIKDVGQPSTEPTSAQVTPSTANASRGQKAMPVTRPEPAPKATAESVQDDSESDEGLQLKAKPQEAAIKRNMAECEALWHNKKAALLHDEEVVELLLKNKIPGYKLEQGLGDMERAVKVRRSMVARTAITRETSSTLEHSLLPYKGYDYERVFGACCENVIGYLPLPLGVAGPLVIDGQSYYLPMATTEGVLVASTNRGCKALNAAGGVVTVLSGDGMTRGPCVGFPTLARAAEAKLWLDSPEGFKIVTDAFNSTSRFARLQSLKTALAGNYLYIRFKTSTGDAMGMNMISKGVDQALKVMSQIEGFEDMAIISVSGNFCIDKKPAAINWIDGRGKSVVAEAIIPGEVVRKVLKSDVNALVELNTSKNLIGSAMAGSIGGFNAHASNIVAAIFLATGQDPAQVVESANCITVMKNNNGNLQLSVSMPSIEVGTIGGGTILAPQSAMLDMLGVRGAHPTTPGSNARRLARIVAASVMAGELSLCSALAAGHLVAAHMQHNRSAPPTRSSTPGPSVPNTPLSPTIPSMTAVRSNGVAR